MCFSLCLWLLCVWNRPHLNIVSSSKLKLILLDPQDSVYLLGSDCSCLLAHPVPSFGTSETLGSLPLFSAFRLGRLAGGGIRRAMATFPRLCRPCRGATEGKVEKGSKKPHIHRLHLDSLPICTFPLQISPKAIPLLNNNLSALPRKVRYIVSTASVGQLIQSLRGASWPHILANPRFFASDSYVSKDKEPKTRLCRRTTSVLPRPQHPLQH